MKKTNGAPESWFTVIFYVIVDNLFRRSLTDHGPGKPLFDLCSHLSEEGSRRADLADDWVGMVVIGLLDLWFLWIFIRQDAVGRIFAGAIMAFLTYLIVQLFKNRGNHGR